MDFLNKLGKKASDAYKVTADKTGKVAKEAKLRLKIGDLKSQINDIYKEIGEVVYQNHIREEEYDISKELEEKCTKIDVLSDEIETHLKECLELRDRKQCPNCFAEVEKEAKFCSKCGQKLEEVTAKEVEVLEKRESEETKNNNEQDASEENKEHDKTNLEKTIQVESDVDENHNETVEHLETEDD